MKYDAWWHILVHCACNRNVELMYLLLETVPHLGKTMCRKDKYYKQVCNMFAKSLRAGEVWYFHLDAFDVWHNIFFKFKHNIAPVKQLVEKIDKTKNLKTIIFEKTGGFLNFKDFDTNEPVLCQGEIHTTYLASNHCDRFATHFKIQENIVEEFVFRRHMYDAFATVYRAFDDKIFQDCLGSTFENNCVWVDGMHDSVEWLCLKANYKTKFAGVKEWHMFGHRCDVFEDCQIWHDQEQFESLMKRAHYIHSKKKWNLPHM